MQVELNKNELAEPAVHERHAPAPAPEQVPHPSQSTQYDEALAYLETGVQSERHAIHVFTAESAVQLLRSFEKG